MARYRESGISCPRASWEIYVYFLNFDPADPDKAKRERQELAKRASAPAEGSGRIEEGAQ